MGVTVSNARLPMTLPANRNQWICPQCSSSNSMSVCHACHQQRPLKSRWYCTFCKSTNTNDHRSCASCGKTKSTSSDATMRPLSVSVSHRQQRDQLEAEKIFRRLISSCYQNQLCFTDDHFPPSQQSLGAEVSRNVTKWLRIRDISPSSRADLHLPWTICSSSPRPADIQQGELGNCWLLAALALITERPEMLGQILLTRTVNEQGVYLVRICHHGVWKSVLLDDYFPCTNRNKLAFSKATKRQLYVPFIEKACAKLFGSYANLHGGSTAEGLQLLTGAPCHQINLQPSNKLIWNKLLSACQSKLLIGTSTCRSDMPAEEYRRVGIESNHAFSLLLAATVPESPYRYLLIRDPHGNTNYFDHSITSSIRSQLQSLYETRPSSGIFWISFPNFLYYFDSLTISTYVPHHFDIREQAKFTRSAIEPVSAYFFYISKTTAIDISLLYHRPNRQLPTYHTQSFVLCDIEQDSKVVGEKEIVLECHRGGFIHWSGVLEPALYVLIPFSTSFWSHRSSEPKANSRNYTLVIHSSIELHGNLRKEPATLLADCLIAATMRNCDQPERDGDCTFYETSRRLASTLIVGENLSTSNYLNVTLKINEARNIRHSRSSFFTDDFLPPIHRQLICVVEWTNREGESAQISYTRTEGLTDECHSSTPFIDAQRSDLHTPRSIRSTKTS